LTLGSTYKTFGDAGRSAQVLSLAWT